MIDWAWYGILAGTAIMCFLAGAGAMLAWLGRSAMMQQAAVITAWVVRDRWADYMAVANSKGVDMTEADRIPALNLAAQLLRITR